MDSTTVRFTVYRHRRNKKCKWVYYAHFYNPETGKRLPAVSTRQTSKQEAFEWCMNQIASNRRFAQRNIIFESFHRHHAEFST